MVFFSCLDTAKYQKGIIIGVIDLHVSFVANTMTRNRYLQIKQCLHVADNTNLAEGSKIVKINPRYNVLSMVLKQFGILYDKKSIEKTMEPYKGSYSIDQYFKSKPFGDLFWRIKFGYKIWSLCGNDGHRYHLDIYCGKSEGPRNEFGLGEKIVLETVNVLKEFFFDNYFTSSKLMKKLSDNRILDTRTVKKSRTSVRR